MGTELRKHLYFFLKKFATLFVFKQQLKRIAKSRNCRSCCSLYATVAVTMCVKEPDYLKDMLVRAKLQFEGFDNVTQPQKPPWAFVWPVIAFSYGTKAVC